MKKLKFIVLEKALSQNQVYKINKGGKGIRMTDEGKAYKESVGWTAKDAMIRQKITKFDKPMVEIVFKWHDNQPHDIDNPLKLTIDALKGICFEDDRQITDLIVKKREGQESVLIIITENP